FGKTSLQITSNKTNVASNSVPPSQQLPENASFVYLIDLNLARVISNVRVTSAAKYYKNR
ncbi:MAG TPA: hypothetical protein VF700_10065, partial [Segetibacter sp.]